MTVFNGMKLKALHSHACQFASASQCAYPGGPHPGPRIHAAPAPRGGSPGRPACRRREHLADRPPPFARHTVQHWWHLAVFSTQFHWHWHFELCGSRRHDSDSMLAVNACHGLHALCEPVSALAHGMLRVKLQPCSWQRRLRSESTLDQLKFEGAPCLAGSALPQCDFSSLDSGVTPRTTQTMARGRQELT